ncbi:permease [Paracoccus onubensis]|uniref:Permease n=2 Tax=Paracoccus onubensis TaxID=1675788 RepID=A0A418T2H2_9RHOB|nr:permease [Paracoccus onubensis]
MSTSLPKRKMQMVWIIAGALLGSVALVWPDKALDTVRFVLASFVEVAPIITVGLLFSAWISASGAATFTTRWLEGRRGVTIVVAAAVGSVSPVCGVTVLPLLTGFLAAGVPLAPVMAFWLSSPVTDPAMFAVTWAVLGPAFAIGKMVAALALGAFGGLGTAMLSGTRMVQHPLRSDRHLAAGRCGADPVFGFKLRVWQDAMRMGIFRAELLAMARLIALCLTFAFAAEHLLRDLMPPHVLTPYVGDDSVFAIPLAVIVGAPMYLDGYAALPLVRGLLDLGMSPGAALAFLVSGGAISIWGVFAVIMVLRPSTITLFVSLAVIGSLAIGYAFAGLWVLLP